MSEEKSWSAKAWDVLKDAASHPWEAAKTGVAYTVYGDGVRHIAADIGSTFQACLYSGWHTQSAAIDAPEHIAESAARDAVQEKVAPTIEGPKIGLEKE